jgi:hypothetical protein
VRKEERRGCGYVRTCEWRSENAASHPRLFREPRGGYGTTSTGFQTRVRQHRFSDPSDATQYRAPAFFTSAAAAAGEFTLGLGVAGLFIYALMASKPKGQKKKEEGGKAGSGSGADGVKAASGAAGDGVALLPPRPAGRGASVGVTSGDSLEICGPTTPLCHGLEESNGGVVADHSTASVAAPGEDGHGAPAREGELHAPAASLGGAFSVIVVDARRGDPLSMTYALPLVASFDGPAVATTSAALLNRCSSDGGISTTAVAESGGGVHPPTASQRRMSRWRAVAHRLHAACVTHADALDIALMLTGMAVTALGCIVVAPGSGASGGVPLPRLAAGLTLVWSIGAPIVDVLCVSCFSVLLSRLGKEAHLGSRQAVWMGWISAAGSVGRIVYPLTISLFTLPGTLLLSAASAGACVLAIVTFYASSRRARAAVSAARRG